jgi:hypothetical protein
MNRLLLFGSRGFIFRDPGLYMHVFGLATGWHTTAFE